MSGFDRYLGFVSISLLLTVHASAADHCDHGYIVQKYSSCPAPTNAPIYKLKSSRACTPIYKSCRRRGQRAEDIDVLLIYEGILHSARFDADGRILVGPWTIPAEADKACERMTVVSPTPYRDRDGNPVGFDYNDGPKWAVAWTDWSVGNSYEDALRKELDRIYPVFPPDLLRNYSIDKATFSFIQIIDPPVDVTNYKDQRPTESPHLRCTAGLTLKVPKTEPFEKCGVDHYDACRDPSHGIEAFANAPNPECGIDASSTFVSVGPPDPKVEKGECLIREDMPENVDAGAIAEKIDSLQAHLRMLHDQKSPIIGSARLKLLLEILRLQTRQVSMGASDLSGRESEIHRLRNSIWPELSAALQEYVQLNGDQRSLVLAAFEKGRGDPPFEIPAGLLIDFPEFLLALQDKYKQNYLQLDSQSYSILFPGGAALAPADVANKTDLLESLPKDNSFLRFTESAVRAEMGLLREKQRKISGLIELKLWIDNIESQIPAFVDEVTKYTNLSKASSDELKSEFGTLQSNRQELQVQVGKFLNKQIEIQEREKTQMSGNLWAFLARAQALFPNPRIELLNGYRDLIELDAPGFKALIQKSLLSVKNSQNPSEFLASLNSLVNDARSDVLELKFIESLLQNDSDQSGNLQRSGVDAITKAIAQQIVPDEHLTRLLANALKDFNGSAGEDVSVRQDLSSQLEGTYREFLTALDKLPATGD
jgi:hypothetical protein